MRLSRSMLVAATVLSLLGAAGCGGDNGGDQAGSGATGLHAKLPDEIKSAGVIRFAGDSHPPYRIVADDGKTVTGIDADIQAALGKELGVKTELSIVDSLPAALTGMLSSRYDAFNGPVKDTPDREKQFDAIAWMVTRTAYLVPKGSTAGIKTSADLCGKKISVVAGSIVEDQVKKLAGWCAKQSKPAPAFTGLADTNGIILAAKSGRVDAAGLTETAALDAQNKEKGAFTYVTQSDEQGAGVDQLAMLVPKSSKLGPPMMEAMKAIFANGEYTKIMEKYGLTNVAVKAPAYNPSASQ
jgi:polar amino acid transport system substrate-binding protein